MFAIHFSSTYKVPKSSGSPSCSYWKSATLASLDKPGVDDHTVESLARSQAFTRQYQKGGATKMSMWSSV